MRTTVAVFYAFSVVAFGCASTRTDLVASGAVNVKIEAAAGVRITTSVLDEGSGHTAVSGSVESPRGNAVGSHVDVVLMDRGGAVMEEVRTEVTHAGHRGRFGPEQGIFEAKLTKVLPQNAVIVIRHHAQEHDREKQR